MELANQDDYADVCICFEEPLISYLFAELLEAQGCAAKIISKIHELRDGMRLVTEPHLLQQLSTTPPTSCLVVGTRSSLGTVALPHAHQTLCRPLSEDKIEAAIRQFLGQ